jgi:hypothetical protein
MGDVICKICGEPWEYYYIVHEMESPWNKKILHGLGCPCCEGKRTNKEDHTMEYLQSFENTDLDPLEFI